MSSRSTASVVTALAPETLQSWLAEHESLLAIDVRSTAGFESMQIRSSGNLPLRATEADVAA